MIAALIGIQAMPFPIFNHNHNGFQLCSNVGE